MSGPKTSQYTLTAEQRRIIMEQRRLELARKGIAQSHQQISKMTAELDIYLEQNGPVWQETQADQSPLKEIRALRDQVMKKAVESAAAARAADITVLQMTKSELDQMRKKLQSKITTLKALTSEKEVQLRAELEGQLAGGFEISFYHSGGQEEIRNHLYADKIQTALDSVSSLHLSDELAGRLELVRSKAEEINSADFLENFYLLTVFPLVKECRAYDALYQQQGAEFEELQSRYYVLCEEAGMEAEPIVFAADAATVLQARIKEIDDRLMQMEEQRYITASLDEAMIEMGYHLIGERQIQRKNGQRYTNELYLFDEGMAVNVTYAGNGQITMELGGIDSEDRLPTDAESSRLTDEMHTFCDDFSELEEYLRKKGIVSSRISILPPDRQFAQIINVTEYDMKTEVETIQSQRIKRADTSAQTRHREV